MKYALITPAGKIMTFYLESVAIEYQIAYGGTLLPIVEIKESPEVVA